MITFALADRECTVPDWVNDIHSFREWRHSDDVPERGRFWWLEGRVWVDLEMEEIFSHVLLKTEFAAVLHGVAKRDKRGLFLTDGVLIANEDADISGEPDGLFVSYETIDAGKVKFIEGSREGYTVLEGSPDMTLEIVSRSSVRKDTVVLRQGYWLAGVTEYWLVDARRHSLQFEILRRTARGFQAVRKPDGWMKSNVFGKSFRLVQSVGARKLPEYTLEVR